MTLQVHDELLSDWPVKATKDPELVARWNEHMEWPYGRNRHPLEQQLAGGQVVRVPLRAGVRFAKDWMSAK